jgi:hypothetical protein
MTETSDDDRDLDPDLKLRLAHVREASWWPIVSLGIAVLVFWSAGFIPWFLQEQDWPWNLHWGLENAGVFGDSFGFINSLMSSLALVGVIAAIWLQKQELMEQRKELIITQWELKKSADAQRDSQRELAKQAKINLQSTILTALQGLEQSAANPMLYPQEEAKSTALFIDGLRQRVIVAILTDDETGDLSQILSTQLNKWRDCTFTISVCRKFAGWSRNRSQGGHTRNRKNAEDQFSRDFRCSERLLEYPGSGILRVDDEIHARIFQVA